MFTFYFNCHLLRKNSWQSILVIPPHIVEIPTITTVTTTTKTAIWILKLIFITSHLYIIHNNSFVISWKFSLSLSQPEIFHVLHSLQHTSCQILWLFLFQLLWLIYNLYFLSSIPTHLSDQRQFTVHLGFYLVNHEWFHEMQKLRSRVWR